MTDYSVMTERFYGGNVPNHQSLSFYECAVLSRAHHTSHWDHALHAKGEGSALPLFRARRFLQAALDTLWCSGADPSARETVSKHFAARVAHLRMARRGGEMDVTGKDCRRSEHLNARRLIDQCRQCEAVVGLSF